MILTKMTKAKIIFSVLLSFCSSLSFGQGLNRTYHGWWASTHWTFHFKPNGEYKRVSTGHFGNTTVSGTYKLLGDTLQISSGHRGTYATVNEYYLMEGDSLIIDLYLRYDYKAVIDKNNYFHKSRIRDVKYPQIDSNDEALKSDLEEVLNIASNSKEMSGYYHFDQMKERQLLIAEYGFLKAAIKVGELEAIFKPRVEIQDQFFIEFEDINTYPNRIDLELKLNGEGVEINFRFYKENGEWKYREPWIYEN